MSGLFVLENVRPACPIYLLTQQELGEWLERHGGYVSSWVQSSSFQAKRGQVLLIPDKVGEIESVLLGQGEKLDYHLLSILSEKLGDKVYRLADLPDDEDKVVQISLAWGLGTYCFDQYKQKKNIKKHPQLVLPKSTHIKRIEAMIEAVFHTRDMINTPACDMTPQTLENISVRMAEQYNAQCNIISGDDLLKQNFPLIHAVGRAANIVPRMIELNWGDDAHPRISLIGKGVCFDTGGLNLKPGNSMSLMKKDMAGAAHVLGLAEMVMKLNLPVRLNVLIGAVENSIGSEAFRPSDVLMSRQGLSVEIGNTDAEGRLVLADLLTYAGESNPDLIIDMATLTGAARVALGTELPAFYTGSDELAGHLQWAAEKEIDPMWRMPLWDNYNRLLSSHIADVNHISQGGFAGSITAALFLKRFVNLPESWVHFDIYGWNSYAESGHPVGGEAQVLRAVYRVLEKCYGKNNG